ncbi:hypothetical protein Bbelb_011170 [Branchiostoma belcheri]|nr:hypothetical protein Bbelb_011170 [Branchiostoma belcheri]
MSAGSAVNATPSRPVLVQKKHRCELGHRRGKTPPPAPKEILATGMFYQISLIFSAITWSHLSSARPCGLGPETNGLIETEQQKGAYPIRCLFPSAMAEKGNKGFGGAPTTNRAPGDPYAFIYKCSEVSESNEYSLRLETLSHDAHEAETRRKHPTM